MKELNEFLSKSKEWFESLVETIQDYAKKYEESENWLSTTLSSIGDAVIATDRLGNIKFVNPIAEGLTGFKREETIGKPLEDFFNIVNEETRKTVENPVSRVIREGIIIGLANHTVLIAKDGKEIPIADSGSPIRDDKGNIIGIVLIFRDITERRKAEKEIVKLAKFPSENPNPVLRVTKDSIIYTNKAGESIFSIKEGDTLPELIQDAVSEAINANTLKVIEIELNNQTYTLDIIPIKEEGYANLYGRDITERKKGEDELRLHSEIMTNMSDGVNLVRENDGIIVYTNPRFEEIFGYKPGELIGKHVSILNASSDQSPEEIVEEVIEILKGKGAWEGEIHNIKKNGTLFWSNVHISAFKHPTYGRVWVAVQKDITEQRNAEKEIVNLAKFPSENPNPVLRVTKDSMMYTNKAGESIFGIKEGDNLPELFQDAVSEAVEANKTKITEIELNNRIYSLDITPIKEGGYVNIYGRDITERKKGEQKLKESEKKFRELFNNMSSGVAIFEAINEGEDFIFKGFNLAGERIEKIKKEDLIGKSVLNVFPGVKEFGLFDVFQRVWTTGKPENLPLSQYKDNRIEGWRENYVYKLPTGEIVAVYDDITAQKVAEQKLKESEKEYREAYNRAELYKDLFTHDINNILQNMLSGIQLSEMHLGDPEKIEKLKEYNSIIKDQIKRGAKLVSNVRELSKIEETEISIKKVEICSILEKSITYAKNAYHYRNINIQVDSVDKKLYAKANELLEDLFENILINAIKYNENSIVEISVKVSKEKKKNINYLKMEFKDNGMGINDSRKKLIFQRGYMEGKSVHGMGLGLSLVKKIIGTYKGKIWIEDRVKGDHSKGSNFVLLIPEVL